MFRPAYLDVIPALNSLINAKYRLAILTNSRKKEVSDQIKNAGRSKFFEGLLCVEDVGKYKPRTDIYR